MGVRYGDRAGNLTAQRRAKAESKPVRFRPDAAQPFDDRMLSWQHDAGTVSIWTVAGRLKQVRFAGHPDHLKTLVQHRRGETDLVSRDGTWMRPVHHIHWCTKNATWCVGPSSQARSYRAEKLTT
jgi:hypothetical protein